MQHPYRTVEDLLQNESFINYCLQKNEEDIHYWESFIAAHPDKRLLVEEALYEYQLLFTALATADAAEQLKLLKQKVEEADKAAVVELNPVNRSRKGWFSYLKYTAIAAAVLVITGTWLFHKAKPVNSAPSRTIQYICKPGERKSVQFPDGTQVILNAGSEILLGSHYGQTTREVFLKGEAFFEVHHNKKVPFIVHTVTMDVKALGTAFNVKSYHDEKRTETVLIRGLVEVTLKKDSNRKLLLHPDEKVSWTEAKTNNGTITPVAVNKTQPAQAIIQPVKKMDNGTVKELAWVQNSLAFDDETFEEIAYQLNRWYNVSIQFRSADIRQFHFTATFKKESIEQVLDILKASKAFNYRVEAEKTIMIYKQ